MNSEFSRVILWKELLTKEAGIKGWYAQQYMVDTSNIHGSKSQGRKEIEGAVASRSISMVSQTVFLSNELYFEVLSLLNVIVDMSPDIHGSSPVSLKIRVSKLKVLPN